MRGRAGTDGELSQPDACAIRPHSDADSNPVYAFGDTVTYA